MLTASRLPSDFADWVTGENLSFFVMILGYLAVLVVLGTFLVSLSILPIIVPFALEIIPAPAWSDSASSPLSASRSAC
jgi:TRAP-type C4-dicarboxylate transport system permease large subunit